MLKNTYPGTKIKKLGFGDLKSMKSSFLPSLFHVTSNKDNSYHYPHCPIGSNSWCKYNADRADNTQTYKADLGLSRVIIYK